MSLGFLAPIAGAVVGGLLNQDAAKDQSAAIAASNVINSQAAAALNQQNINFQNETNYANRVWVQQMTEMANNLQEKFAQMGIQWRVQDAQNAGLHPLFALGGGGAAYSPTSFVGPDQAPRAGALATHQPEVGSNNWQATMGQDLARSLVAALDPEARLRRQLELRSLEASVEKDQALAGLYASQAARNSQAATESAPMPSIGPITTPYQAVEMPKSYQLGDKDADYPGKYDVINPKGVDIESVNRDSPYSMAGPARAGLQRYRLTRNMELLLPYNQEGWTEALESLPYEFYPMVYQANKDYYGKDIWRVIVQEMGAQSAFARWVARRGRDESQGPRWQGGYDKSLFHGAP